MILACLVASAFGMVTRLTKDNFTDIVTNRNPQQVWFIMFESKASQASKNIYKRFEKAALDSGGAVLFGVVDGPENKELTSEYDVKRFPYFRLYHKTGDVEFTGPYKIDDFNEFSAKYVKDMTVEANIIWPKTIKTNPSAILFTQSKNPFYWVAISSHYAASSVRIGITSDAKVAAKFGIYKMPSILFVTSERRQEYTGEFSFAPIRDAIDEFFDTRLNSLHITSEGHVFYKASQFDKICNNNTRNCIIINQEHVTEDIIELEKKLNRERLDWLVGTDLPYDFQDNSAVLYSHKRNSFSAISSIDDIQVSIERMCDGTIEWVPADKLSKIDSNNIKNIRADESEFNEI